jgi:hypothetical protein
LMNVKKHRPGWRGLDPRSSAAWFDGFRDRAERAAGRDPPPVLPARTWLATRGWRVHGLISVGELPRLMPRLVPPGVPPRGPQGYDDGRSADSTVTQR